MATTRKKARVVRASDLSPSVRLLSLEPDDGPLDFEPGQWIDVELETAEGPHKRAYSLANPAGARAVEIAVTRVEDGRLSPALHQLELGSELAIDGPHGFFTRDAALKAQPSLFVATGTGLAPFRSMLLSLAQGLDEGGASARAPITVLFGCRSQADILWREELTALSASGLFRFEVSLSRPDPGYTGRTGYVQTHVAELAHELGEPHVYICGLNKMVAEVRAVCKQELGYPRQRIHSERYD